MPSCLRLDQNAYFWIMLYWGILQNNYIALFVLLPGFYFLDQLQEIYLGSFAWRLTRLRALHVKSEGRVWTKESVIVTPREMSLILGNLQRLDRPKNLNHRDFFGRPYWSYNHFSKIKEYGWTTTNRVIVSSTIADATYHCLNVLLEHIESWDAG